MPQQPNAARLAGLLAEMRLRAYDVLTGDAQREAEVCNRNECFYPALAQASREILELLDQVEIVLRLLKIHIREDHGRDWGVDLINDALSVKVGAST